MSETQEVKAKCNWMPAIVVALVACLGLTNLTTYSVLTDAQHEVEFLREELFEAHGLAQEVTETSQRLAEASEEVIQQNRRLSQRYDAEIARLKKERYQAKLARYIVSKNPKAITVADQIVAASMQAADAKQLDVRLILAVMEQESMFKPHARGSKGEVGLMQIMPFWVDHLDFVVDLKQLEQIPLNVRAGAEVISRCMRKGRTMERLLQCYNGGGTYARKVLARYKTIVRETKV